MTSRSRGTRPSCKKPKPVAEHDFETVASETVYIGNIFALRVDDVRMPHGNVAKRDVVENYGAVAILALDDDRNVVMVYQYRHPFGRRLLELPAGLLDLDGEAPHLTAARELNEEAGVAAAEWRVLIDLDTAPGFSDESVRVYLATGLTDVDRPDGHDEEADLTLARVPLDEAAQMVLAGEIVNSIAVAGILAAHAVDDHATLRPVDAPWIDRSTSFARRKGH